jgi:hypothetical protein
MPVQTIRRGWAATLILASLAVIAVFAVEVAPAAGALSMKGCELVTAKDVQGVLGDGYTPQNMTESQVMSVCGYKKGADNAVLISLQQTIYASAQYLRMEQEGIKQQGGAVTSVAGLGEGAFYLLDPGKNPPIFQLHFGKGNQEVILTVMTGGKPNIDAAQKLAKIAYSRLR